MFDQNPQYIFQVQSTTARLKALVFHLPCLSQYPSPGMNCTYGSLRTREKQQNILDVNYGISGRHSDATLRETLKDFYMI